MVALSPTGLSWSVWSVAGGDSLARASGGAASVTVNGAEGSREGVAVRLTELLHDSDIDEQAASPWPPCGAARAADQGADIGTIQTLLGHTTAAMARRYAGQALDRQGARLMVQYSPVG